MERDELIVQLNRLKTLDNHRCFGCGKEHNCSIHGCVIIKEAIKQILAADQLQEAYDAMARDLEARTMQVRRLQDENTGLRNHISSLTDAQAVMVRQFEAKLEELAQVKAERDAAVHDLRGECPVCEHVERPNAD